MWPRARRLCTNELHLLHSLWLKTDCAISACLPPSPRHASRLKHCYRARLQTDLPFVRHCGPFRTAVGVLGGRALCSAWPRSRRAPLQSRGKSFSSELQQLGLALRSVPLSGSRSVRGETRSSGPLVRFLTARRSDDCCWKAVNAVRRGA